MYDLAYSVAAVKYVPSWVPGTGRQRQAVEWRQATEDMVELPYRKALDLIVRTSYCYWRARLTNLICTGGRNLKPSYTSRLLDGLDPKVDNSENELMIKQTASTIYSGMYAYIYYGPQF